MYLLKVGSLLSLVVYGSVDNSTIKFYLILILIEVGLHGLTLFAIKSPNVKYICKDLWLEPPTLFSIHSDLVD